jgi:hypothetical protein
MYGGVDLPEPSVRLLSQVPVQQVLAGVTSQQGHSPDMGLV